LTRWPESSRARLALAVGACLLALPFTVAWLQLMSTPGGALVPFADANNYLAAGERLNAGHGLYQLALGDRYVVMAPTSPAPFLSPPFLAVLWRPLAAIPLGFWLWMVSVWVALLGTAVLLAWRTGIVGAVAVAALAPAIGEQLAAGNVAAFFPALMLIAWRYPGASGIVLGVLAAMKLSPVSMGGWLAGSRAWVQLTVFAATILGMLALSVLGAGLDSFSSYLGVAQGARPSHQSLSGITGLPWLSYVVLAGGTILAIVVGRRSTAASFAIAVAASVLGTPALYMSGLVTLLAMLSPLAYPADVGRRREPARIAVGWSQSGRDGIS
jgi:hypothetical protein